MTPTEREHLRHIASIARAARKDLSVEGRPSKAVARTVATLEEIENSARHALAYNLQVGTIEES